QRGRDRPLDEWLGNIHDERSRLAIAGAAAPCSVTSEFCRSLYWPSTTTRSPSPRPDVMMVKSPDVEPEVMARACAMLPSATTQVKMPSGPRWIATDGMVT